MQREQRKVRPSDAINNGLVDPRTLGYSSYAKVESQRRWPGSEKEDQRCRWDPPLESVELHDQDIHVESTLSVTSRDSQ